jgi:hypothetical protein
VNSDHQFSFRNPRTANTLRYRKKIEERHVRCRPAFENSVKNSQKKSQYARIRYNSLFCTLLQDWNLPPPFGAAAFAQEPRTELVVDASAQGPSLQVFGGERLLPFANLSYRDHHSDVMGNMATSPSSPPRMG